MSCQRARRRPGRIGDDLSERRQRLLGGHLAACESCRMQERELAALRAELAALAAPSFDETERQEIRREVWRRIENERAARGSQRTLALGRPAWAAVLAAVGLLTLALVARIEKHRSVGPWRNATVTVAPSPAPALAQDAAVRSQASTSSVAAHQRPRAARPTIAASAASPGIDRIELATRDPQVRIIWLVPTDSREERPAPSSEISQEAS